MFRISIATIFTPKPVAVPEQKPAVVSKTATIKPEDAPERLIEVIQNLAGNVSKEEREAALVELIARFQYLIRKFTNQIYYGYNLKQRINYDHVDFLQDTLTEFCYLVTQDFKIKSDSSDTGLAVFGSYIKVKLYRRIQYKAQEKLRKSGEGRDHLSDFDVEIIGPNESGVAHGALSSEIRQAIVANALHYDDMVLNSMSDEDCSLVLQEIIDIANTKLEPRDRKVWELYYLSAYTVSEIGQYVTSKIAGDENKPIGRQRVLQVARDANNLILQEFGRRAGLRRSGI